MTSLNQITYPNLLGTALSIVVEAHPRAAEHVQAQVLDEVARLERVFDPIDPDSELSRWRRGACVDAHLAPDLARVLAASEHYWVLSRGAFHPGAEPLVSRWRQAERDGVPPTTHEMAELAAGLQLPYTAVQGPVRRTGDCSRVELNSIARGYVLDRALEAGWALGLASSIVVEAGGDLRHRGAGAASIRAAEVWPGEPGRLPDGLTVSNAALSRSWRPRSAFLVGERRYRDVIDPRTGWPNDEIVAVAAIAADAMAADVTSTMVGVGRGGLPGSEWLALHADGRLERSDNWPAAPDQG